MTTTSGTWQCGHTTVMEAGISEWDREYMLRTRATLDCVDCRRAASAARNAGKTAEEIQAEYLAANRAQIEAERPMTEAERSASLAKQSAEAVRANARLSRAMRSSDPSGI